MEAVYARMIGSPVNNIIMSHYIYTQAVIGSLPQCESRSGRGAAEYGL